MRARSAGLRRRRLLAAVAPLIIAIPCVVALTSPGAAADTSGCPASNPPNELALGGGTPQTAQLATAFGTPLQVALANSNGCPVTSVVGTPITFTAPSSGAGGSFATSGTNAVTVGADLSGNASAPTFTANDIAGSYTVTASSAEGSVVFSMTNSAAGIPASVTALSPASQSATVKGRYAHPLSVRVLDAAGNPVSGASVTFAFGTTASGGSGGSAGASFANGSAQATAVTTTDGVATSPRFSANGTAGGFTATATATTAASVADFTLSNRAGKPVTITAGVAASEATQTGTRFAIALAVTVTDAFGNKVPKALVTFTAPASGASGSFATRTHSRSVTVRTDGRGIAVAPPFIANAQAGGYIAIARIPHGPRTAFALVNEAP